MSMSTSRKTDIAARLGSDATSSQIEQAALSLEVLARNEKDSTPYPVNVLGKEFIVLPGVFSPKYFDSTPIFTENLPIRKGDKLLEIGAGTGITSVMAALKGASKVVAIDINAEAVRNVVENAKLHLVDNVVQARVGDVFSAIKPGERFNLIYWNLPFIYMQDEFVFQSTLERSLFDPGYQITRNFLSSAPRYLTNHGQIYVGFGNFGEIDMLNEIAGKLGYSLLEIVRRPGFEGVAVEFILYELRLIGE